MSVFWILTTKLKRDGTHIGVLLDVPGCQDVFALQDRLANAGGIVAGYKLEVRGDADRPDVKMVVSKKQIGLTATGIRWVELYEHKVVETADTVEK